MTRRLVTLFIRGRPYFQVLLIRLLKQFCELFMNKTRLLEYFPTRSQYPTIPYPANSIPHSSLQPPKSPHKENGACQRGSLKNA
jgi:hypothetical protein